MKKYWHDRQTTADKKVHKRLSVIHNSLKTFMDNTDLTTNMDRKDLLRIMEMEKELVTMMQTYETRQP
jgi:hypothetical protein